MLSLYHTALAFFSQNSLIISHNSDFFSHNSLIISRNLIFFSHNCEFISHSELIYEKSLIVSYHLTI